MQCVVEVYKESTSHVAIRIVCFEGRVIVLRIQESGRSHGYEMEATIGWRLEPWYPEFVL